MKDLPHHRKKLNRKVIRSSHREELQQEAYDLTMPSPPPRKKSERQIKKQAKIAKRKEKEAHVPTPLTLEEKNRKMKKRVPIFGPINHPKPIPKQTRKDPKNLRFTGKKAGSKQ